MSTRTGPYRAFRIDGNRDGSLRIVATEAALIQLAVAFADARVNGVAVLPMTNDREIVVRRWDGDD